MAQKTQRKVRRSTSGRSGIVATYNARRWYNLPDWACRGIVENIWWVCAGTGIILLPATAFALVAGFHQLPLQYFGIPGSDNAAVVSIVALLLKFTFLALAIRPLYKRRAVGWNWLIMAAAVNLAHGIYLSHGISSGLLLLLTIYLAWQTKPVYE